MGWHKMARHGDSWWMRWPGEIDCHIQHLIEDSEVLVLVEHWNGYQIQFYLFDSNSIKWSTGLRDVYSRAGAGAGPTIIIQCFILDIFVPFRTVIISIHSQFLYSFDLISFHCFFPSILSVWLLAPIVSYASASASLFLFPASNFSHFLFYLLLPLLFRNDWLICHWSTFLLTLPPLCWHRPGWTWQLMLMLILTLILTLMLLARSEIDWAFS